MDAHIADYSGDVSTLIADGKELSLAVAFITKTGVDEIRKPLVRTLRSGGHARVLIDLSTGATDPSAVWELRALAARHAGALELRAYVSENAGILHAKLYVASVGDKVTFIAGSANLSRSGLHENVEHGLAVTGGPDEDLIEDVIAGFEALWESPCARIVDETAARLYETFAGRRRAAENRAHRRSRAAWRRLADHLAEQPPPGFVWPSVSAGYLLGAITARGELRPRERQITLTLGFRASAYKDGMIRVQGAEFPAAKVLPSVPAAIAQRSREVLPGALITVNGFRITLDLANDPATFDSIVQLYWPALTCHEFRLPRELATAGEDVVSEFVKGFAVASALLTDDTSMPGNKLTGLPGQMVVWLRPKQGNEDLFNGLYELIQRRLGITVYRHARQDRDPHLKIRCEDFAEIGFGIEWWDALVEAGTAYNLAMFPHSG